MEWYCEIKLRFRWPPFKIRTGFLFEWKAWLLAYDLFNIGPEEFNNLEQEVQITALTYGAAVWNCIDKKKKVYFSYDDIVDALNRASKADNKLLADTLNNAQFPEWLKKGMDTGKKKVKAS